MKNKYLAILLSVSIVFSSLPALSAYAAADTTECTEICTEQAQEETDTVIDTIEQTEEETTFGTIEQTEEKTTFGTIEQTEEETTFDTIEQTEEVIETAVDILAQTEEAIEPTVDVTAQSQKETVLLIEDSFTVPASFFNSSGLSSYSTQATVSYNTELFTEENITSLDHIELDTLLLNEDAFRSQLETDFERQLYDAGKKSIIEKGYNYIKLSNTSKAYDPEASLEEQWAEICNVFSALSAAYPNKFNWMNWTNASFGRQIYHHKDSDTYTYKYTLKKSDHYTSTLEKKADSKVKALVQKANTYAKENYPQSPAYGIIEYFNDWLCENNYFEREHGTSTEANIQKGKIYYYSHSCYGPLLYGYGTSEGYALAMSRLLDGAGIRNLYVTGYYTEEDSTTEYAWNYVEMPDGYWYLIDTVRNDDCNAVDGNEAVYEYLLIQPTNDYEADSRKWKTLGGIELGKRLDYDTVIHPAPADYLPDTSEEEPLSTLSLNAERVVLKPNEKYQLSIIDPNTTTDNYYGKFIKTWESDNPQIVKVNSSGKITAGTLPGKATITAKSAGKEFTCEVFVYQFTNIKFNTNNKNSYTISYANPDKDFDASDLQSIELTVNQKKPLITAAEIVSGNNLQNVKAVSNKPHIAKVDSVTLTDNTITLNILPKAVGTAKITISLAGKKAYYTIRITQDLLENWFDYSNIETEEGIKEYIYTGKAITPSLPLTEAGRDCSPKATYTITYFHNKKAGEATVTIQGTGKYSGRIEKTFIILPKDLSTADFRSCSTSKTYNAKARAAATDIRIGKTTLVAGRDYTVFYKQIDTVSENSVLTDTVPTNVGTYEVTITGKGNYTGTIAETKIYTIKPNSIKNMAISYKSSLKYTGKALSPLRNVKIGKNLLPEDNYTITYLDSTGTEITAPIEKGNYTLVITPIGENVKPTLLKKCIKKKFTIK